MRTQVMTAEQQVRAGGERRPCHRLRAASKGLDHDEIAARLAAIRQSREVEGQDKARELERVNAEELEREAHAQRERGLDHGL